LKKIELSLFDEPQDPEMNNPLKEHEMGDYCDYYEDELDDAEVGEKVEVDDKFDK